MRLLILSFFLFTSGCLHAFPPAIAKKILGRPISEDYFGQETYNMADAIIEGANSISMVDISVGNPPELLHTLIVEPRNYGFKVKGEITRTEKSWTYTFGLSPKDSYSSIIKDVLPDKNKEIEERLKNARADGGTKSVNFKLSQKEFELLLREQARRGSEKPSTAAPKTVFLLNGYGMPKETGLPMALMLADHGIRSILPDLRGQGESSGKGVTWGKHEPNDLEAALSLLQSENIVEDESIAVIGISYGAAMACLWAAQDPRIQTCILVAPYQQADKSIITVLKNYKDDVKFPFPLKEKGIVKGLQIAEKRNGVSWQDLSPLRAVPSIRQPVLFVTSTGDKIIPKKEVEELHQLAPKGSEIHTFKAVPHEILGANFTDMEPLIVDWLKKSGFLP